MGFAGDIKCAGVITGLFLFVLSAPAVKPLEDVQEAWEKGDYAVVVTKAVEALKENEWKEDLWVLQIRALMAQGKYEDALKAKIGRAHV